MTSTEFALGVALGLLGALLMIPLLLWPAAKMLGRVQAKIVKSRDYAIDVMIETRTAHHESYSNDDDDTWDPGCCDGSRGGSLGAAYNLHGQLMPTGITGFDAAGHTFNEDAFGGSRGLFDDM